MNSQTIHVLLFEDNPGDALLFREYFRETEFIKIELDTVDRLRTGLEHLAQKDPDIILLDLGLPDSQGLETFTQVYAQAPNVPIIILTGLNELNLSLKAVREGAQDYLVKGEISGDLLVRAIRYAIERKRAKKTLDESEQEYSKLFETSPVAISLVEVICDAEGRPNNYRFLHVNPAYERFAHAKASEIVGRTVLEIAPQTNPAIIEQIGWVALTGKSDRLEAFNVQTNTHYEATLYSPRHGQCVVLIVDITERKRSEEALQLQAQIMDQVHEGIVATDLKGLIVSWNKGAKLLLGYSSGEVVGKPVAFVFPQDQLSFLTEVIQPQVRKNGWYETDVRFLSKSGKEIPVHLTLAALKDDNGAVIGMTGSAIDITDRVEAVNAIRESAREFQILAESMPQIVWVTRPDGWNIYFNKQWVDYTGLTLEESYGHGWNKPFHPDDQQRAWDAWQNATQNNGIYSLECRLRRADGVYKWWLVRGVPMIDEHGIILKWFGTCTDIHELKKAELKLTEQLNELKRWQNAMLGREDRIRELKTEINSLLAQNNQQPRYHSTNPEESSG